MRFVKDRTGNAWLSVALIASAVLALGSCTDQTAVRVGGLRVIVITEGEDQATSYSLAIDGDPPRNIGVNYRNTLQQVPAGSHEVRLSGLPSNCTPSSITATVQVVEGTITEAEFRITCVARTGSIVVSFYSVVTNGTGVPDGYTVMLDDQPSVSVAGLGAVTIAGVREGSHRVRLAGLPANCFGGGEVTRTVTFGAVTNIQFEIHCTVFGALRITVSTTGQEIDANGYRARIDTRSIPVPANGTVVVADMIPGTYSVALEGVAANCEIPAAAVKTAIVSLNQTTNVAFGVTCAVSTAPTIAYAALSSNNWDVYVVRSNGQGITRLTSEPGRDVEPDWSPDGRIAFASERTGNFEIYAMNADGTNQTRLTNDDALDTSPAWSPDGSKIAFISSRDGNAEIYVMNADGTGAQRLTSTATEEADPAWSPTGTRLAFTRQVLDVHQVHLMNANGTGVARFSLSGEPESGPTWSPDGNSLALARYTYYFGTVVLTMRIDGTGPQPWLASGDGPTWSQDGLQIAYRADDICLGCLATVNPLTNQRTTILAGPVATPAWRR